MIWIKYLAYELNNISLCDASFFLHARNVLLMMCILNACRSLTFNLIIHSNADEMKNSFDFSWSFVCQLENGMLNCAHDSFFFNFLIRSLAQFVLMHSNYYLIYSTNIVETNVSESLIQLNDLRQIQSSNAQSARFSMLYTLYSSFIPIFNRTIRIISDMANDRWLTIQIRQLHT